MTTLADHPTDLRAERSPGYGFFLRLVRRIEAIMIGRVNWVGEATLLDGTTSTTVADSRVLSTSQITLMAEDSEGGTAIQAAYIDTITEQTATSAGSFKIHHAAPPKDVAVRYCIKG